MKDSKYQGQRAISYARASVGKHRGKQLDSTDRQIQETKEYCDRYGLVLDTTYSLVDEGVSAFRKVKGKDGRMIAKNLSEGSALAKFSEEAKKGAFPDGVHLIVEKLDRMYRDDPELAMEHMLALKRCGVTIHTTMDDMIYDPTGKEKQTQLLISVIKLCSAHEFSKALSQRQLKSRERRIDKMKSGETYFTPMGAKKMWIQKVVDPETKIVKPFVSHEDKFIINQIFKFYIQDGMSGRKIAEKLNNEGIKTPMGHSWQPSRITEIIKDRAVIGWQVMAKGEEFYFPETDIVKKEIFQQANEIIDSKFSKRGRPSDDHHIFDGLMVCGYCLSENRRTKGKLSFIDTTLRYSKDLKANQEQALKVKRPYTSYRCSRGQEDKRNCNGYRLDYYDFYDTFFAFVKELDFSAIIDDSESQNHEHESKLLLLRNEIGTKQKEKQKFEKLLDRFEDDEDMFNEYAEKMKETNSELKLIKEKYEEEKTKYESKKLAKTEVIQNEKEIKELLGKAHNYNEWYACETMRVDLEAKKFNTGKYECKTISKSDDDKLDEIWSLDLAKTDNKEKDKIRYKYFSKEIKQDEEAVEMKMKLNALLKKYIKKIEYHPFGFGTIEKTKPFAYRKEGECSCNEKTTTSVQRYLEKNKLCNEDNSNLNQKKWSGSKIMKVLEIGSNSTLTKFFKEGMPDPREKGVSIQDTIKWKQERDFATNNVSRSKKTKSLNTQYKKFAGFSVEFTDICKANMIKYVMPYHKDRKSGIAYNLNTKTRLSEWESNFGDEEIKMSRRREEDGTISKPTNKEKNYIYVEDDKIMKNQLYMMIGNVHTKYPHKRWRLKEFDKFKKNVQTVLKKYKSIKDEKKLFDYMKQNLDLIEEWEITMRRKKSLADFRSNKMDDAIESRMELTNTIHFKMNFRELAKQFDK